MANFVVIPLKRSADVDFVDHAKIFIANVYNANPEEYHYPLMELNKLRSNFINKMTEQHESGLDGFYRYYDQLNAIEGKLPISESQIRINFRWQDALGKKILSLSSGMFEKASVLFNIAALHSFIAESKGVTVDDNLKVAAKLLQQASGIFSYLSGIIVTCVTTHPTVDLHPDTLTALSALMLAQAQDCFVRKAIDDNMKPAIIAKLAYQCSKLYADASQLMQVKSIRGMLPRDWLNNAASKEAAYCALAHYHQSFVSKDSNNLAEQIARLRQAKDSITTAEGKAGRGFPFMAFKDKILASLKEAEKDNDFIYHLKIPPMNSLPVIETAAVAKSLPVSDPMSSGFQDMFQRLVPACVHESMMIFENRKSEILNQELGRLREATQLLNEVLSSLNLPAALEDLSGGRVPNSILDKAFALKQSGADRIGEVIVQLPGLLQRNKEILDEAEKMLNEEESSDRQLRMQLANKWTRTSSDMLNKSMKQGIQKYRSVINNAVRADGVVKQRYHTHRDNISLLMRGQSDLERVLPSASPAVALKGLPVVGELQKLMDDVRLLKQKRDELEKQFKDTKFDMATRFLKALALEGVVREENISVDELERYYGPLKIEINKSINEQSPLLEKIQLKQNDFARATAKNPVGAAREKKLKELAQAADVAMELMSTINEGYKFYHELTDVLLKFQNRISDFCLARKTEKDELLRDMSSNLAGQAPEQSLQLPSYLNGGNPASQSTPPMAFASPMMPQSYNPYGSGFTSQSSASTRTVISLNK